MVLTTARYGHLVSLSGTIIEVMGGLRDNSVTPTSIIGVGGTVAAFWAVYSG